MYALMFISIVISAVAHVMLKYGVTVGRTGPIITSDLLGSFIKIFQTPTVAIGFMLYGAAALMWIVVLSKIPLSIAYPTMSINYIIIMGASKYLFKEDINLFRIAGTVLIVLGVVLVQVRTGKATTQPGPRAAHSRMIAR